jgi:hypothetical protein
VPALVDDETNTGRDDGERDDCREPGRGGHFPHSWTIDRLFEVFHRFSSELL